MSQRMYATVQFRSCCKVSIPKDMVHALGWNMRWPIKIEMSDDEKSVTLSQVDPADYELEKVNTTWQFRGK